MTIEEIKAYIKSEIEASDLLSSEEESHMFHLGEISAYEDLLRLLNDWNGK